VFENVPVFPLDKPALRPLEMVPVRHQGQNLIMVRDPLGVIEGAALLAPDPLLLAFLEMADGNTTTGEMTQKITMATGQIMPAGIIDSMVQQLDEALMLQSERFVAALRAKYEAFLASPTRPYKVFQAQGNDRLAMMKQLGDEFRRHRMSALSPPARIDLPAGSVVGILSPHIDYNRGGEAYAWAYQALKDCGTGAKTYIVLGTVHRPTGHRFVATKKNYDTPFGAVETDTALLDEIAKEFGGELFAEEYVHADEHSIELQAVYLKQVFGDKAPRIVPILCGTIEDLLEEEGASPMDDPEVRAFTSALRTVLERHGDSVGIIGGVDFSHCGTAFGDEQTNDDARTKEIESGDRAALAAIESGKPDAFFDTFRADFNARKVCSITAIYCTTEALRGRAKAKTLAYHQSNSPDKSTLVSFASVAFVKEGVEAKPVSRIILATR